MYREFDVNGLNDSIFISKNLFVNEKVDRTGSCLYQFIPITPFACET